MRVALAAAAKRDLAAIRDWYAQQRDGLDLEFQQEVDRVLNGIEAFPKAFPTVHQQIQRAVLTRFPYSVFFRQRTHDLFVIAVIHHARHPRVWKRRI